ncbi:SPT [Mytilus edulis]|uniref:SPT n=1 Tax=Mytilus edulis TaxID=6550 RepID=A0A8S3V1R4_MYTED|nr:SPT [Mytilus edulis]
MILNLHVVFAAEHYLESACTICRMKHQNGNTVITKDGIKTNGHSSNGIKSLPEDPKDFQENFEETPIYIAVLTYLCYGILVLVGHVRDFLRNAVWKMKRHAQSPDNRVLYHCFKVGKVSIPAMYTEGFVTALTDQYVQWQDLPWMFWKELHKIIGGPQSGSHNVINLGSYNYLGFSDCKGPCAEAAEKSLQKYGTGTCASKQELGFLDIHQELDLLVAEYLGMEAAITMPMGFATNSMNMPSLVGKGSLILSDELNHASLVLGSRLSGATIKTFKHNDMADLEKKLKAAVVDGQPRRSRAWKKKNINCG